jgi:hypothetical protein
VRKTSPDARHIDLLRAYNHVEPFMRERAILPEEAGSLYRSLSRQVLWTFEDLPVPPEESERSDLERRNPRRPAICERIVFL